MIATLKICSRKLLLKKKYISYFAHNVSTYFNLVIFITIELLRTHFNKNTIKNSYAALIISVTCFSWTVKNFISFRRKPFSKAINFTIRLYSKTYMVNPCKNFCFKFLSYIFFVHNFYT